MNQFQIKYDVSNPLMSSSKFFYKFHYKTKAWQCVMDIVMGRMVAKKGMHSGKTLLRLDILTF